MSSAAPNPIATTPMPLVDTSKESLSQLPETTNTEIPASVRSADPPTTSQARPVIAGRRRRSLRAPSGWSSSTVRVAGSRGGDDGQHEGDDEGGDERTGSERDERAAPAEPVDQHGDDRGADQHRQCPRDLEDADRPRPPLVADPMADPGVAGHRVVGHAEHEEHEGHRERHDRSGEGDERRQRHEAERGDHDGPLAGRGRDGRRPPTSTCRRTRSRRGPWSAGWWWHRTRPPASAGTAVSIAARCSPRPSRR